MQIIIFIIILISPISYAVAKDNVNIFETTSYQKILKEKQDKPFVLVLWSLDCPPCMEELNLLQDFYRSHQRLDLVFISTDTPSQNDEILQVMNKYGLSHFQQWVFSSNAILQLRHTIDASWYGELPRSYFHSKAGRYAISGKIDREVINKWYKSLPGGSNLL